MKIDLLSLKLRHATVLVMLAILSPHFMIAAQERGSQTPLSPNGCMVAVPDKLKTSAFQPAALSCELSPGTNQAPHEGPTDYARYVRPEGEVASVMFFVDFSDAPQNETTLSLYNLLVPNSVQWFSTASYGKLSIAVTPVHKWFRMPKPSTDYNFARGLTYELHRTYIADALAAADSQIDFKQYKSIYIVASRDSAITFSPTFAVPSGFGVFADGVENRSVVTFGSDIRFDRQNYGSYIFIHETGHLFGLPDLYAFQAADFFDTFRYLGGWNVMSWVAPGAMFNAWELRKLGWLDKDQIRCLGAGQSEETLTALEESGGLKALVIPTGPSTAYVIEVRQPINTDSNLCDKGVLFYTVNANEATGAGPIVVKAARTGNDQSKKDQCGPLYNATLNLDPGGVSGIEDLNLQVKVEVLSAVGNGYRVRVINNSIACSYSLNQTSGAFAASGGNGSVALTTDGGCLWNAASNANWITVISGSAGSGNATISYTVAVNPGREPRAGTLSIADKMVSITQTGTGPFITGTSVKGKKLFVLGDGFDNGAVVFLNGKKQKTSNDETTPASKLIAKKIGKKVRPGDRLQVINGDGMASNEFTFPN
jgi:M6 family metalloprotease-like protein